MPDARERFAGRLRTVVLDGDDTLILCCPECDREAYMDEAQAAGRVSLICPFDGCDFHETHDFWALFNAET